MFSQVGILELLLLLNSIKEFDVLRAQRGQSLRQQFSQKKKIYSLGRQLDREAGGKTQFPSDKGLEQI